MHSQLPCILKILVITENKSPVVYSKSCHNVEIQQMTIKKRNFSSGENFASGWLGGRYRSSNLERRKELRSVTDSGWELRNLREIHVSLFSGENSYGLGSGAKRRLGATGALFSGETSYRLGPLDEILKTIEPMEELENNLFFRSKSSTSRNAQTIAPKKNPFKKERSVELEDDEGEILTSMSSNNGRSKSTASGKSLQKTQPTDRRREVTADNGDDINVSSRARRRNSKLGREVESSSGMSKILDDNKQLKSNMSTGLWSGDDLWKIDGNDITNSMHSNPLSSNTKSNLVRDSSGNAIRRSPDKTNSGKVQEKKNPGKYDWLGLLDEEGEEDNGPSHANKDQVSSSKYKSSMDQKSIHQDNSNSINVNSPIRDGGRRRSDRGYAPTISGGLSESVGRRRRNGNGPETTSKLNMRPNFDPLGLFSLDDANETANSKLDKPLPSWLTPSNKKSDTRKEDESKSSQNDKSLIGNKESRGSLNVEENGIPIGNSEDMKESKDPSKLLTEPKEDPKFNENEESLGNMEKAVSSHVKSKGNALQEERSEPKDIVLKTLEGVKEDGKEKVSETVESVEPSACVNEGPRKTAVQQSKSSNTSSDKSESHGIVSEEQADKMDKRSTKKHSRKRSPPKSNNKKVHMHKVDASDEDISSTVGKVDSKNGSKRKLMEKHYTRKIREMERQLVKVDALEEDLKRMRYLEEEVNHLKSMAHLLETEKSAAEALVDSMRSRHEEQLKRLKEIHESEIESMSMALLREKQRGAEEVRLLAADHRKALDRLTDYCVKLEEQFKNRMLEARKDWSRDIEALRQAYQQSNSAAITNASLALLTGHSFGTSDAQVNNAAEKRDEVKSVTLSPPEVKELSQAVQRIESMLTQALDSISPKINSSIGGGNQNEAESKNKGPAPTFSIVKKSRDRMAGKKKRTLHKTRALERITSSKKNVEDASEGSSGGGEHLSNRDQVVYSDEEERYEQVTQRTAVSNNARHHTPSKKGKQKTEKHFNDAYECGKRCQSCPLCHFNELDCRHCLYKFEKGDRKRLNGTCEFCGRSLHCSLCHCNELYCRHCLDKHETEGRNHHFHFSNNKEDWREDKNIFAWGDKVERLNVDGENRDSRSFNEPRVRGDAYERQRQRQEFKPHSSYSMKSNDIIDPKQYLLWLASGNIDNLFQPSNVS